MVNREDAKVSVFDHGFLYGDGVFEGIRSYNGRIWKLEEHVKRLYASAHTILLQIGMSQREMIDAVAATVRGNNLHDAYIRLVVSRGEGDLGLDPRKCSKPNIIIIADKIVLYPQELYEKGIQVVTVPTRRNLPEALNAQVKSLNYLNNILAKIEATNAHAQEALMLSSDGYVAECTGENVFFVREGQLVTSPVHLGVLKGITATAVMDMARARGVDVVDQTFTRYDLWNADEAFLTGTAAEIVPVVMVDGRQVGSGTPGELTRKLREDFKTLTQSEGYPIYEVSKQ
ncbi:MAG: branched-chain-amino-acid transaminase [Candidatus Omnitrophica bacterium]|nr:branched-chain-amino-acid transaminase [Candidatus Omnitrophota bacterium]